VEYSDPPVAVSGEDIEVATGQTVVYRAIISVVTEPSLAGQSVTVGAQFVTVYVVSPYTVEVVYSGAGVEDAVRVIGQTVV